MKALVSNAPGGPDSLELVELPDPDPGKGDVVIRVHAVGVNYPDVLIIEDKYQFKPERPFSPGGEVSGVIESVGEGVTSLKAGDRVLCVPGWGGMQEKIVVDASRCVPIPDAMPFDEAAAFVLTYGTTHYGLKWRGNLQPGETLFVPGAAGGVGIAAVELGKAMGATVIAGVSSEDKLAMAREKGADEGFVYPRGDLDRAAQKAFSDSIKGLGGGGVDVVYDAVGGDYAEPMLRALNWEGRYLVIGFPAGIPRIPLNLTLLKSCQIIGVFWGAWTARRPDQFQESLRELFALYSDGKIKPHVSETFSLENGGDAIRTLAERKAKGKLVVTIA